jgi:hypothetical protein
MEAIRESARSKKKKRRSPGKGMVMGKKTCLFKTSRTLGSDTQRQVLLFPLCIHGRSAAELIRHPRLASLPSSHPLFSALSYFPSSFRKEQRLRALTQREKQRKSKPIRVRRPAPRTTAPTPVKRHLASHCNRERKFPHKQIHTRTHYIHTHRYISLLTDTGARVFANVLQRTFFFLNFHCTRNTTQKRQ